MSERMSETKIDEVRRYVTYHADVCFRTGMGISLAAQYLAETVAEIDALRAELAKAERERDSAREALRQLEKRRDQMAEWLQDNAPFVFSDQKHLDADTPERSYWHHGYMMALTDALAILSQGEQ